MIRARVAFGWLGIVLGGWGGAAGCSKDPTLVNIVLHADDAVPAVTTLQITLTQAGAQQSGLYRSVISDTEAGAEPFHFPATVEFNFASASDSTATIAVEALDGSTTRHVVASGAGVVDVKPNRTVTTDVTLSVSPLPPPPDAGAADAGAEADAADDANDPGAPGDAGDDASDDADADDDSAPATP